MGTTLKIGMDANGNKVVRIKCEGWHGFSVQTDREGLEALHKLPLNSYITRDSYIKALKIYLSSYGTPRQRLFPGLY